jgi:hypothetical protein
MLRAGAARRPSTPSQAAHLVRSLSRYSPHFMEPEGSLPHSQIPATCPYPKPDQGGLLNSV